MSHRFRNIVQSLLLLASLLLLMAALGWLFAGVYGIVWGALSGLIPFLVALRLLPETILRMYGAKPLRCAGMPVCLLLESLASRAALPLAPRLYFIAAKAPIIFSVGTARHAGIAVTAGLLELLDGREVAGVLAHEVSHIRNHDTVVMTFADIVTRVTGAISVAGQLLVLLNLPFLVAGAPTISWVPLGLMVTAPLLSALLQLALSRSREYDADLHGALLTGDAQALASALTKLDAAQPVPQGRRWRWPSLLRTHPPTAERVRRLDEIDRRSRR